MMPTSTPGKISIDKMCYILIIFIKNCNVLADFWLEIFTKKTKRIALLSFQKMQILVLSLPLFVMKLTIFQPSHRD